MEMKFTLYRKLFTSTFYLSAFTFGGGYVIVPLMRKEFVEKLKWIDEKEMMDMVAIASQSWSVSSKCICHYRISLWWCLRGTCYCFWNNLAAFDHSFCNFLFL